MSVIHQTGRDIRNVAADKVQNIGMNNHEARNNFMLRVENARGD